MKIKTFEINQFNESLQMYVMLSVTGALNLPLSLSLSLSLPASAFRFYAYHPTSVSTFFPYTKVRWYEETVTSGSLCHKQNSE